MLNEDYKSNINILPRTKDLVYVAPKDKKEKTVWDFDKSIFRHYQMDNEVLLKKCFETDFNNSRISRLVKEESDLGRTKDILWNSYK